MNLLQCRALQRIVAACVSIALIASGVAGCATVPSYFARIEGIIVDQQRPASDQDYGLVTVTRDGGSFEGRAGMELRRGDRVATGPRAEVVIRWASGSLLYMRPNSSGRIGSFFETLGEVFAKIRGAFEVETTFVRAGAAGTSYLVRAAPDGETTVIVFEGTVVVDSTRGAWAPVTLGAGQMVFAHPRPPRPFQASEADLQSTREWVERLERQVPETTTSSSAGAAAVAAAIGIAVIAILGSRNGDRDRTPPQRPQGSDGLTPQRPPQPQPLGAPTRLSPDQGERRGQPLLCSSPITLRWTRVDGARSYLVRVERQDDRTKQWRATLQRMVDDTRLVVEPGQLGTANRWSVQARDGDRSGPVADAAFGCQFYVVR